MSSAESFEKERLRFCEAMFDLEKERKQIIERQAQFYFGIISFILGLFILRKDTLEALQLAVNQPGTHISTGLFYAAVVFVFGTLILAIFFISMVFKPERRQKPYPPKLVTELFGNYAEAIDPASQQADGAKDLEVEFLKDTAVRFALAVEKNSVYNTQKSLWLIGAAVSTFALMVGCAFLSVLALATYL